MNSTEKDFLISLIIPAYNEQDNVKRTYDVVSKILNDNSINFEMIFIDDGSKDLTYERIVELSVEHKDVVGLSFSRNFGKEAALFAGLEAASGDACVVMDCDLQHPPIVIPQMVDKWLEGYEVVEGIKLSRGKESIFHKLSAQMFYGLISKATGIDMANASDFKLLDRKAINALLQMPERAPFFRALSSWIGFKSTTVPFEVQEREIGSSKWSTKSLFKYAIQNITSFSGAPMQFVSMLGWIFFVFGIVVGAEALYEYFTGNAMEGFTTVILLQLLSTGLLMISLGIIGHYLSKIYDEIKARPKYIVSRMCGKNN